MSKASNDDIDASERLGSLYWSIVFVVNSEKLQESASDFLNSSNWKTGLRNLFHDFCSFLPFKYACNRALSSNLCLRLFLKTLVGNRALHVFPCQNLNVL